MKKSPKASAKKQKQNPQKTEKKRKLVTNKKSPKASAKKQKIVRAEAEDVSPENQTDTKIISDEEPLTKLKKKIKLVVKQSGDGTVKKKKKKKVDNKFVTKCRPNKLVDVIKRLNDGQKKAVREMGFGGLLDLKITFIPQDDVHDIFQLPRVGEKVELIPTGNSNKTCDSDLLKTKWRKKFGLENKVEPLQLNLLHSRLMSCEDAGDEFKKIFVLYTMSVFLAPTSNYTQDFKLLKTVEDVSHIRNCDWCLYVFEQLVESVRVFKTGGGRKSFVSGCILVLMMSYLHRIDFKLEVSPHSLPLIKHWDDKKLSERVRNEALSGSLGNGFPTKTTYPICVHLESEPQTGDEYMLIKLPPRIENDKQIRAKTADDILAIFLRMKRDSALFYKRYTENMEEFKAKTSELLINDPKLDNLGSDKSTTSGTPSKDNLSAEHAVQKLHKKYGGCTDKDLNSDCKDIVGDDMNKSVDDDSHLDDIISEAVGYAGDCANESGSTISDYFLHSETVPNCALLEAEKLGCTIDCGKPDKEMRLVSEWMLESRGLVEPVLKHRKEVMDYCFVKDNTYEASERLASYGYYHFLTRSDVQSLLPGVMIQSAVIECWSIMMNALSMKEQEASAPKRLFFGLTHAVFLPLLMGGHYFCVCINFKAETVNFLDNRVYKKFRESKYRKLANLTTRTFGSYLQMNDIEKDEKVRTFPIVNREFKWQSTDENLDCGLFMMIHMMFYYGRIFDCDLKDEKKRELYRAEVAPILIMSDYKENRDETMKTINKFSEQKESLELNIFEEREERSEGADATKEGEVTPKSKIQGKESSPTSVLGSRRRGESDGLGCTYDCGLADDKVLVVSKFMRANQALCSNLLRLRKEVVDYCLLDDHTFTKDETVTLYSNEEYLTREDILSIRPTAHLTGRMIECWAHLLNDIEYKDPNSSTLMFFCIRHMDVVHSIYSEQHEGGDEDVSMISKIFSAWDHFIDISKASCMSKYLEAQKIPGADKIIDFHIVNLQFPWKSEEPNDPESDNFLMIHMIRYEGEVFETDIHRKTYRRYYWIEMAAALLLADINEVREELLKKVGEFSKKKEGNWEILKKERNDKIEKMKKNIMEEDKAMNKTKKRKVESKQVKVKHVHTEVLVLRSSAKNTGGQRGHEGDRGRGRGRGRGKGRGKN
ncbi:hypothetical protein RND81_06G169000 [Saponaria officinalis]|uniref:Ubiquitin-like protease family profile domain-containing protein n=1 Tax=Saponaria officinalis TaxID=3572 RepID=A0AAW1KCJ5_SAPOF